MTTTDSETPLIEGDSSNSSSPPLELNERKSRISLWCILFWIVALAGLTANGLLLQNQTNSDLKTVERLYAAGDFFILLGIIITIIYLYVMGEQEILKFIGGCGFIIGGLLHIAGTSKYVDVLCPDNASVTQYYGNRSWCRVPPFGGDFMMEYLAIFIGIDIITFYFDTRILRLIPYCCILSICCLLIGSYTNHQANLHSDTVSNPVKTTQSAYIVTGIVSGILFIVLLVIQVGHKSVQHNETTRYVHLVLGFILMTGAGLIFYTLTAGYQTLLVIATAVIIAYELQYM